MLAPMRYGVCGETAKAAKMSVGMGTLRPSLAACMREVMLPTL